MWRRTLPKHFLIDVYAQKMHIKNFEPFEWESGWLQFRIIPWHLTLHRRAEKIRAAANYVLAEDIPIVTSYRLDKAGESE